MQQIDGGTIVGAIFLVGLVAACVYLKKNWGKIFYRDDSPIQQAKKDWRWSLAGSAKEESAAKQWDILAVQKIMSAGTFQELDEAYEKALTYSAYSIPPFWELLRRRESSVVCEAFKTQRNSLREKKKSDKITNASSKHQTKCTAPRLEKLPTAPTENKVTCSR